MKLNTLQQPGSTGRRPEKMPRSSMPQTQTPSTAITRGRHILWPTLAALTVLTVSGCGLPSKEQMVNNAETRWKQMRSTLMIQMAEQQFATGDLDQSERTLADAMSIDPSNTDLYVLSGRIAIERGQLERAFHLLNQAIEIAPSKPDGHYYQGIVLQRWQRYDAALDQYRQAHELEADNVGYLLAMGEMLVATERLGEAKQLFESKLVYFDQNAAIRVAIAQIELMQDRPEQAAHMFREASILQPEALQIREDLAFAQLAAGDSDAAIATLRDLIHQPEYVDRDDLQRLLAEAYMEAGRAGEAREIFLKLGRRDPSDVDAWIGLAQAAWQMEDVSATLYASDRITRLAPRRHEGYVLAGLSLQKKQQWADAARMFDQAVKIDPRDTEFILLRGFSRQHAGQPQLAAADYQHVLKLDPTNERAQRLLGQMHGLAAVSDRFEP